MKFKLFITAILLGAAVWAHEGHDHDGPVSVQAPKGGTIKKLDDSYLELVSKGNTLNLYFYDVELKAKDPKSFAVTAEAQKPKSKKTEEIKLQVRDMSLEGAYDAKGAHRYTLVLKVKDPREDHADTVKFTVEPKK